MPLPHKPTDGSDDRIELLVVPSPVMNVHVKIVSFIHYQKYFHCT